MKVGLDQKTFWDSLTVLFIFLFGFDIVCAIMITFMSCLSGSRDALKKAVNSI